MERNVIKSKFKKDNRYLKTNNNMITLFNSNTPYNLKLSYCFTKAFRQQLENNNVPKINNITSSLSIRGSDILFRPLVGKRHFW